jgi:hypothetical protein
MLDFPAPHFNHFPLSGLMFAAASVPEPPFKPFQHLSSFRVWGGILCGLKNFLHATPQLGSAVIR